MSFRNLDVSTEIQWRTVLETDWTDARLSRQPSPPSAELDLETDNRGMHYC